MELISKGGFVSGIYNLSAEKILRVGIFSYNNGCFFSLLSLIIFVNEAVLFSQLTPIERYAIVVIEGQMEHETAEELKNAEVSKSKLVKLLYYVIWNFPLPLRS